MSMGKFEVIRMEPINDLYFQFQAAEICNETGDRAASYHLARQFENQVFYFEVFGYFENFHCRGY